MTAIKAANNKDMNGLKVINLGVPTGGSTDATRQVDLETARDYARSRANHTGTQLAATISDFDTQVRTSRLDQLAAPAAAVGLGGQRIASLADPTSAQDAATRNYVDTSLAGVASGQVLKGTVRAATTANVNIASAPATIDGITPANGDIFLLAGQTTGTQNGPYTWTSAGTAMARAGNWDAAGEAVVGSYWIVREGTSADKFALLTNDTFTLGTSTAAFSFIGVASAGTAPVEQDLGNGALTSFAITHSFGTRAVNVVVYRVASPYDEVDVYVEHTDLNTVTLKPDVVWAANEFHAVVSKM
jgi:hypothetical protein